MGNPNEFTIRQLAEKVIAMTQSNSKLIYLPLPQNDPVRRRPDISLAAKILEWKPTMELEEGLRNTISYFSNIVPIMDVDTQPERLEKYFKKTITESS
jgi:UDP-glucuronate decarboxylase